MGTMSFDYRTVPGEPYLLPLVDLYLLGPQGRVLVRAVVDSGAVRPIFPRKAAEDAGLKLPTAPNDWIQYGGGRTGSWLTEAHLTLGERRWAVQISFVERLDLPYALLGRRGVFAQFNTVAFIERAATPRVEFSW